MVEPLIEDVGIYITLGILILNTVIIFKWISKESKKLDEMYEFIKKLSGDEINEK